tara:strand:- start:5234 stop:5911 length:678 start_codon:yes stop_codon:yes gene_type:complete
MIVTIHQPNFLPYFGLFHKVNQADIFVIQDDVKFDERWGNRNKIISSTGYTRLNVPILKGHKFLENKDVKINNLIKWRKIHWKKITGGYNNAKYFHLYKDYFKNLYEKNWEFLFELNFEILKKCMNWLGIKTKIVIESDLNVAGKSTERLVNVCKAVGADSYLSGVSGRDYLNEKLFEKNNIELRYQNYESIKYAQNLSNTFIPNLSIIDVLSNIGPEVNQFLKN